MTSVLHLSDPHFGTEQPAVVDALVGLVRACQPELVLLGGDITQRARSAQFAAARRFVDRLAVPTLVVPGNHDIPLFNIVARLLDPYGNYRRAFGPDREPVYSSDTLLAIGVDSTRPQRHKNGYVSSRQIERVARLLDGARPGQLRIVLMHHPLVAAVESDQVNLAGGRENAMRVWSQAGADLLLGGHIHLPYVAPLPARINQQGTWAVQAGTAVSHRIRGGVPNSVNIIDWAPERTRASVCRVQRWDYLVSANSFVPAAEHELALSRQAWRPSEPDPLSVALGYR